VFFYVSHCRFALSAIGRVNCFQENKVSWWKNKAIETLGNDYVKPSALRELGVLAGMNC